MIEKRGRTKGTHYVLSKTYYEYSGKEGTLFQGFTLERKASLGLYPRTLRAFQTR